MINVPSKYDFINMKYYTGFLMGFETYFPKSGIEFSRICAVHLDLIFLVLCGQWILVASLDRGTKTFLLFSQIQGTLSYLHPHQHSTMTCS